MNMWGKQFYYLHNRTKNSGLSPIEAVTLAEQSGAGEVFLNSIERDGTRSGYDLELIRSVASSIKIPLVACGGANDLNDCLKAIEAGASAVAAGSIFVYSKGTDSVLINYPSEKDLMNLLYLKLQQ